MNKKELISCLDRARNGVVKVNNDEEGDFVVKKLKEFGSVCLDSKLPSEIKTQYPICIGTGDNDWWTAYPFSMLNVIEFEEFKKIVESEEDENNTWMIGNGNWGDKSIELELVEESKVDPPITRTDNKYPGNPFNSLKIKRSPLHLYSIEELEKELERRRNQKLKALENTINTAFEELISMGYKIHNVYSEDNMDGEVNISIEKKEVLIRGGKIKYE